MLDSATAGFAMPLASCPVYTVFFEDHLSCGVTAPFAMIVFMISFVPGVALTTSMLLADDPSELGESFLYECRSDCGVVQEGRIELSK